MDYKELKKDELLAKCIELDGIITKLEARKAGVQNKPKIKAVTPSEKNVARLNALTVKKRIARENLAKKK